MPNLEVLTLESSTQAAACGLRSLELTQVVDLWHVPLPQAVYHDEQSNQAADGMHMHLMGGSWPADLKDWLRQCTKVTDFYLYLGWFVQNLATFRSAGLL